MRKQLHYVTLFLLFFTTNTLSGENYVDLYINTYKEIAIEEMMRSGIPASITLSQGIHESSWGKGELAIKSNNHFGIKCKSYWQGPSFYYEDDDYDRNGKLTKSCFRAYENPEKSYKDHTDFLMTTAHYQVLFNYSNTDYKRWAKGLKKCGYATDNEYANKLIRTIEKYQLYKYDILKEQRVLASAPKYNIPKQNTTSLLIKTEKKEEQKYDKPRYTVMNVPQAIPIPEDYYERKPIRNKEAVFVKYETAEQRIPVENGIEEEIMPAPVVINKVEPEASIKFESVPPPPIQTSGNSTILNMKKESIIPSAFASTKRTYQLSRKPRTENSALR